MRGRKPLPVHPDPDDVPALQRLARSEAAPWFQVRRARTLLGLAQGQRVRDLAGQLRCGTATIRRTARRYQRAGLEGLLARPRGRGRSPRLSPPAAGAGRATGLPGAGRQGAAHHPLDQR